MFGWRLSIAQWVCGWRRSLSSLSWHMFVVCWSFIVRLPQLSASQLPTLRALCSLLSTGVLLHGDCLWAMSSSVSDVWWRWSLHVVSEAITAAPWLHLSAVLPWWWFCWTGRHRQLAASGDQQLLHLQWRSRLSVAPRPSVCVYDILKIGKA